MGENVGGLAQSPERLGVWHMIRVSRRKALALSAAAVFIFGGVGAATVETELTVLDLGVGKRLLFLTDIHGRLRTQPVLDYDVLLIGGDTYDEWTRDLSPLVESLSRLKGPKVAVLGNHEYMTKTYTIREGVRALEEAGVHVLIDDWVYIGGLKIYGLDWRQDPRNYPPVRDADVVLAHSPDAFQNAETGIYLTGHTHGGQICLPKNRPIITNSAYGYTWGLYKKKDAVMYTSRGVGEMLPRVHCDRQQLLVT
ncbi:MAG: metallophosphoesterase [Pyrobaculum sp.]